MGGDRIPHPDDLSGSAAAKGCPENMGAGGNEDPGSRARAGAAQEAQCGGETVARRIAFPPLPEAVAAPVQQGIPAVFHPVELTLSAELGKTTIRVQELISLKEGSVLKLDRLADENVTLLANEAPFAEGEVVVINDRFAVRLVSFAGEARD